MLRRLSRLSKEIDKRGLLGGINWLLTTLIRRIFPHRQVIFFADLMEMDSNNLSLADNVEIKKYSRKDEIEHAEYIKLVETGTELMGSNAANLIEERFRNGGQLWVIRENGLFAGYGWAIVKDPLTPTFFPHTEKDVHHLAGEVFQEFRGREVFRILTQYMLIDYKKEGFSRFYGQVYEWNKASIRANSKFMRKIGVAKRFSILGREIVIWYEMLNKPQSKQF